jgi:hypothetical protein
MASVTNLFEKYSDFLNLVIISIMFWMSSCVSHRTQDVLNFRDEKACWKCKVVDEEDFRITYYNGGDTTRLYFVPVYTLKSVVYAVPRRIGKYDFYRKLTFKRGK